MHKGRIFAELQSSRRCCRLPGLHAQPSAPRSQPTPTSNMPEPRPAMTTVSTAAAMPDPTTTVTRRAVPANSAKSRRGNTAATITDPWVTRFRRSAPALRRRLHPRRRHRTALTHGCGLGEAGLSPPVGATKITMDLAALLADLARAVPPLPGAACRACPDLFDRALVNRHAVPGRAQGVPPMPCPGCVPQLVVDSAAAAAHRCPWRHTTRQTKNPPANGVHAVGGVVGDVRRVHDAGPHRSTSSTRRWP